MELRNITKVQEGTYQVDSLPCPDCNDSITITLDGPSVFKYHQGGGVHSVLPHLDDDDRERFITGYCGPCWNELFPDEEEEDDE